VLSIIKYFTLILFILLDNSSLQESPFTSMKDSTLLEESEQGQPALMSAMERERRKDNFQQFLSRQHAAQEKKKIQVEEVKALLHVPRC
jgi:hypothetical protein